MRNFYVMLLVFFYSLTTQAQVSDAIKGIWMNPEKDGKIEIYEQAGKFYGKLIWIKLPYENDGKTLRKDINNKDTKLRSRPLLNIVLFSDFIFKDGKWVDGEIYDPKSGKTYSCQMSLKGDKLDVRGYIGNPMFGRTIVFTRQ